MENGALAFDRDDHSQTKAVGKMEWCVGGKKKKKKGLEGDKVVAVLLLVIMKPKQGQCWILYTIDAIGEASGCCDVMDGGGVCMLLGLYYVLLD